MTNAPPMTALTELDKADEHLTQALHHLRYCTPETWEPVQKVRDEIRLAHDAGLVFLSMPPDEPSSMATLTRRTGLSPVRVDAALDKLVEEGEIELRNRPE